jgi:hypothetical protein
MSRRSLAVSIAAVEGSATIHGHDPIAKRDFTLVITRHYVDRRNLPDGFALADDEATTHDDVPTLSEEDIRRTLDDTARRNRGAGDR